jgi:mono/diheme cytochrome c family protein
MRRIMTISILFAVSLLIVGFVCTAYRVQAEDVPAGQAVFLAQKCNLCHAVSSAGIEAKIRSEKLAGGDLKGIGERRDADWIAKFVRKEIELDGAKHKKLFTGSDEELQTLIAWLQAQK